MLFKCLMHWVRSWIKSGKWQTKASVFMKLRTKWWSSPKEITMVLWLKTERVLSKLGKSSDKWSKETSLGKSVIRYVKVKHEGWEETWRLCGQQWGRASQAEKSVQRPWTGSDLAYLGTWKMAMEAGTQWKKGGVGRDTVLKAWERVLFVFFLWRQLS